MSSLLKKHRATDASDPDAALEDQLMDEMDSVSDGDDAPAATDPRWDKLKDVRPEADE